ncbi:MAG: hypothetical protein ACLGHN_06700 [Bacteriovoracia bacterium]
MNLLLILLLIPLSFAGSPPDCDELGKILQGYEKDIQKAHIDKCQSVKFSDLVKQDPPSQELEIFTNHKCSDFATIEAHIQRLVNERDVLMGFKKLKEDIKLAKDQTASRNAMGARAAGMSFVDSLNTAQSFELILNTLTSDDKSLLVKIKALPPTVTDLKAAVKELCNRKSTEQDACNPELFNPGAEAMREILHLARNNEITPANLESWRSAITIKRKNPSEGEEELYSFNQMQREMQQAFAALDSKEVMSKEHLKAIQSLDDFKDAPGLTFINNLQLHREEKKEKIISDRFLLHMGEAKARQQIEVRSKLSVAWQNLKTSLPNVVSASCDAVKDSYDSVNTCLSDMKTAVRGIGSDSLLDIKSNFIQRFFPAIDSSVNYINSLSATVTECSNQYKATGTFPESCFNTISKSEDALTQEILQLNALKSKIGDEKQDLMKFRNFALQKWQGQKCSIEASPMELCESSDVIEANISKELFFTKSNAMDILMAIKPEDTEAEALAKELCLKDERKNTKNEDRLCDFFNDTTSDIVMTPPPTHPDGPTDAPDGEHDKAAVRDALILNGSKMLGDVMRMMLPRNPTPPGVNPYPMNYGPFNGGRPPLGISDTIMFNARFQGAYGFYMPTPGFQPHTIASGPAMSTYRAAVVPNSRYFGR